MDDIYFGNAGFKELKSKSLHNINILPDLKKQIKTGIKKSSKYDYDREDISGFDIIENSFYNFLKNIKDPLKQEYILTDIIEKMIVENTAKIKVLETPDKWHCVTYKDDTPMVQKALTELIEKGLYKW